MEARKTKRVNIKDEFNLDDFKSSSMGRNAEPPAQPNPRTAVSSSSNMRDVTASRTGGVRLDIPLNVTRKGISGGDSERGSQRPQSAKVNAPRPNRNEENDSDAKYTDDDDDDDDDNSYYENRKKSDGRDIYRRNKTTKRLEPNSRSSSREKREKFAASQRVRQSSSESRSRSRGENETSESRTRTRRPSSKELEQDAKKAHLKDLEFSWNHVETLGSEPPSNYTITHINQNHDLMRLDDIKMAPNVNLNSIQWLESYSLEKMKLTLKDLLAKGTISKPISDKSGKAIQQITFDASVVNEFEYKLNISLEMYSKRIKWLMQSSRKTFGLVQGNRIAVVIDSSNTNMSFGRAIELQDSLLTLIDEQLSKKKQFYFLTFGTDANPLWDDTLKDVYHRTVQEAKVFVTQMKPSGGCNLLRGLKRALSVPGIDSLLLIVGSVPDQSMDIICDYIYQSTFNKPITIHCVSYEINNHIVNSAFKKLAEETSGRFHCFSNSQEETIYNSTDINILLKEIQKVQDVLNKISDMKQGMLGSALIQIENQISLELDKFPQSKFMPKPRGHDMPLSLEKNNYSSGKGSVEWLEKNGLKAQKLNLYQVLAPNAYSYIEDYVPILNKTVQSQVHERVMVQFTWHDGTVKNIHVDLASLFDFQKRLKSAVQLFEKRIDWLSTGSRKIFGTIAENSVVILVDLSYKNQNYLIHIQHSLRLLLEQQIPNKKCFNIITFGREIKRWKPTVVKPTPLLLQDAWKWILEFTCEGTRNLLGALRMALENDEEKKHGIDVEGLYLFTSGIPDQPIDVLCSYLEENACGRNLKCHAILFNVDDYDINGAIPGRWANITKTAEALRLMAHTTYGGRFHWFRETGIIESDDIKEIQHEIDRAIDFSRKGASLVDKIKGRKNNKEVIQIDTDDSDEEEITKIEHKRPFRQIMPPKPTTLSLQRMMMLREKESEEMRDKIIEQNKPRSLPWRPNSAKTDFLPLNISNRDISRTANASPSKPTTSKKSNVKLDTFYLGKEDNAKGIVVRQTETNAHKKSWRKPIPTINLSDKEENLTTKEWLRKYSLNKLKLDLHKLVSGPECKHDTINTGSSKKEITSRHCSIFPSINLNGTVRHLQLKHGELKEYQQQCEKALKRYIKRLQWLLSGSRRLFGTIVHDKCAILVDTSGSMNDFLSELKRELACLVWEQLYKYRISFNFIKFSDHCEKWRDGIVEPTEENCHKSIAWLANLTANGNTCTLEALKEAFDDEEINAIYLITDGKPDTSTTLVLDEVRNLNSRRHLSINVISINCDEKSANDFLCQLAAENYGRYHRSSKSDRDIHLFSHKILTEGVQENYLSHIPEFESDDLRRLAKEIDKAKLFLKQSNAFSNMYENRSNESFEQDVVIGPIHISTTKASLDRHRECVPVDFLL